MLMCACLSNIKCAQVNRMSGCNIKKVHIVFMHLFHNIILHQLLVRLRKCVYIFRKRLADRITVYDTKPFICSYQHAAKKQTNCGTICQWLNIHKQVHMNHHMHTNFHKPYARITFIYAALCTSIYCIANEKKRKKKPPVNGMTTTTPFFTYEDINNNLLVARICCCVFCDALHASFHKHTNFLRCVE